MKILEQAFSKIKPVRKNTYNFFLKLIEGLIGTMGKGTFRNMAQFMQIDEHTFSRQIAKPLDFQVINTRNDVKAKAISFSSISVTIRDDFNRIHSEYLSSAQT